jgi:NADH-quinone oxidoreductase subunit L
LTATTFGWLILAFPLAGMLIVSFGWKFWPGRSAGWIATAAIGLAFVCAVAALFDMVDHDPSARAFTSTLFDYANTSGFNAQVGILVDQLSVFMCLVVTGVSFLIHLYSVSYMTSDRGFNRYFAYLNFFVFSMLLLVLAGNFVLLIVGWAFVGAASYLLISFWYRRTTATHAGIKAFVINVIGDIALVIATFLLFNKTHSLDLNTVFEQAQNVFVKDDGTLVAACLLLLVGAFAKSAQLPLHTWLPDAMEGPTPVSALIHAATMVTAGVYLIARTHTLFELAPSASDVAAIIGAATLVFAATVAVVVTDLKRSIAYSTISQIGYMVLGVSVFAYTAGLFQLATHAFFKALLFMGAGSVISAMGGIQDMDKMGGFRKALPFTFATFTAGALALAAFPLTSGFFSKDDILGTTLSRGGGYVVLAVVGYAAAFITAIYAFRMVFRVFFRERVPEAAELEDTGHLAHHEPENPGSGEKEDTDVGFPGAEHHIAEREWPMKIAMSLLALGALLGGILGVANVFDPLEKFLDPVFAKTAGGSHIPHPNDAEEYGGELVGGVISIIGISTAWFIYIKREGLSLQLMERFPRLHDFLVHKWYFDELYDAVFVRPILAAGRFGNTVIESDFVQGTLVGGATALVRAGSSFAHGIQSGYLRAYALLLLMGLGGLGLYFLLASSF